VIKCVDESCFRQYLAKKQCQNYMRKWIGPDQARPVQDYQSVDRTSPTFPLDRTGLSPTADRDRLDWWNHWKGVRAVVTAQEGTEILRNNRRKIRKVWKEFYYGKAETLEDAEEAARWWRYNLVR